MVSRFLQGQSQKRAQTAPLRAGTNRGFDWTSVRRVGSIRPVLWHCRLGGKPVFVGGGGGGSFIGPLFFCQPKTIRDKDTMANLLCLRIRRGSARCSDILLVLRSAREVCDEKGSLAASGVARWSLGSRRSLTREAQRSTLLHGHSSVLRNHQKPEYVSLAKRTCFFVCEDLYFSLGNYYLFLITDCACWRLIGFFQKIKGLSDSVVLPPLSTRDVQWRPFPKYWCNSNGRTAGRKNVNSARRRKRTD